MFPTYSTARKLSFLLLLIGISVFLHSEARAAENVGDACGALGVSTIAEDKTNLIACMLKTPNTNANASCANSGGCIWKSMTKTGGGIPVGAIIAWPSATNPKDMQNADGSFNWIECAGQTITQSSYPDLFQIIGGRVPDLRGVFLRGLGTQTFAQNNGGTIGTTSTAHASAALGQVQGDALRNITGYAGYMQFSQNSGFAGGAFYLSGNQGRARINGSEYEPQLILDAARVTPTANEIRPINMAVRYLIRARS